MDDQIADDVIRSASVAPLKRAFFLGPLARRVNFASQQHRILNLIWALRHRNRLPATGANVAVVGGGITGVMASVTLANLGHTVTLFESRRKVLRRQASARHRYIHPTINLWPSASFSYDGTTSVPYFDWHADVCSDLIAVLYDEWEFWRKRGNINIVTSRTVKEVRDNDAAKTAVVKPIPAYALEAAFRASYDIVLVTTGFADEKMPQTALHMTPYWSNDNLDTLREDPEVTFIVSGCGDGGMIDALRIAHNDFKDGRLIINTMNALREDKWSFASEIARVEDEIADAKDFERQLELGSPALRAVYEQSIRELPRNVLDALDSSILRIQGLVQLACKEEHPYSPNCAPIHKLLYAHAASLGVIEHYPGDLKADTPTSGNLSPVPAAPGAPIDPAKIVPMAGTIVVRHGAAPNFGALLHKVPGAAAALMRQQRLEAANLDAPYWQKAENKLLEWPPPKSDPLYSVHLNLRLPKIRHHLKDLLDPINASVGIHRHKFRVSYRKRLIESPNRKVAAANRAYLERIPDTVFGFPLEKWDEDAPSDKPPIHQQSKQESLSLRTENLRHGGQIAGGSRGRLGVYVKDRDGKIYGVTARHVLERLRRDKENEAPTVELKGHALDSNQFVIARYELPSRKSEEAEAEITAFPILPRDDGAKYEAAPFFKDVVTDLACYDATCLLVIDGSKRSKGRVVSTEASPRYRHPTSNEPLLLSRAVEIEAEDEEKFSFAGDSGAPVVLADGALLGILIGGLGSFSYVAPIAPFLAANGFSLASDKDLHRAQVNIKARSHPTNVSSIADINWSLAAMQTELQSELITTGPPPSRKRPE